MSRRTLINLVFFALVGLAFLWWAVNNIVVIDALERPYSISADFEAASGVLPNAEVTYLGVHYGRVTQVDRMPGHVRVSMKIDRGKRIPAESIAHIYRKSAIGEPYIDFRPSAGYGDGGDTPGETARDPQKVSAAFVEPGDRIPLDRTRIPLEFSELLRSADRLVAGISPDDAEVLVHELATALGGRGDALRQLTQANDQLAATFAARTELLDRLTTNNTRLTHVVAQHRGSLGASLTNLRLLAESLRDADGDVEVLLDRGTALLGEVGGLVRDTKGDLDCVLHGLVPVMRTAGEPERLDGTVTVLERGPAAFANVMGALDPGEDGGPWIRVNLLIDPEHPAEQYEPPKELPPVPEVQACTSSLASGPTDSNELPASGSEFRNPMPAVARGRSESAPVPAADFDPRQLLVRSGRSAVDPGARAFGAGGGLLVVVAVVLRGRLAARMRHAR